MTTPLCPRCAAPLWLARELTRDGAFPVWCESCAYGHDTKQTRCAAYGCAYGHDAPRTLVPQPDAVGATFAPEYGNLPGDIDKLLNEHATGSWTYNPCDIADGLRRLGWIKPRAQPAPTPQRQYGPLSESVTTTAKPAGVDEGMRERVVWVLNDGDDDYAAAKADEIIAAILATHEIVRQPR